MRCDRWHMNEIFRMSCLALFVSGPIIAVLSLLCRRLKPSATLCRIKGWRWYVPPVLLPVEWLLPPVLLVFQLGEIEVDCTAIRIAGLAIGLGGVVLLFCSAVVLGRFLIHEASVREDHDLVSSGPYRFIRHPVYTGFLALLLGSGIATLNVYLMLLWPVSLLGILIQAASEEQILVARFGQEYERYVGNTGRLVPRFWRRGATVDEPKGG